MSSSLFVISLSPFSWFTNPCSCCFFDGHFETIFWLCFFADFDVHDFLLNFPDLKAQVKRTPHEDELFGYLAKSALNTDLSVPTKVQNYSNGKYDQDAVYWIKLSRAQCQGLRCWHAKSNAIILQNLVTADFIYKVSSHPSMLTPENQNSHCVQVPMTTGSRSSRPAPSSLQALASVVAARREPHPRVMLPCSQPSANQHQGKMGPRVPLHPKRRPLMPTKTTGLFGRLTNFAL